MIGALLWLLVLIIVLVVAGSAAWAGWRAAPYVPTRQHDVERMLRLAQVMPADVVYDLGAGDGRFVITAAQAYGAKAVGYEISFLPYLIGRWRCRRAGVGQRARMVFKDFYKTDLSAASVVVCFLTPGSLKRLGPKLLCDLQPGTRVVSFAFAIADWAPSIKDKPDARTMAVYLYKITGTSEHL